MGPLRVEHDGSPTSHAAVHAKSTAYDGYLRIAAAYDVGVFSLVGQSGQRQATRSASAMRSIAPTRWAVAFALPLPDTWTEFAHGYTHLTR